MPKLTMEALAKAMEPPNNCKVKPFIDGLDKASREVFEQALSLDGREFSAGAVRMFLLASGFDPATVPGEGSIQDHRSGKRPCRCRG